MDLDKNSMVLLVPPIKGLASGFKHLAEDVAPNVSQVVLMGNMFNCPYIRSDEDVIWATHRIIANIKKIKRSHPNFIWLINKHDLPYWYEAAPKPVGYNTYIQRILHKELPLADVVQHFWLSCEVYGWLLSSCGWSHNAGTEAKLMLSWPSYARIANNAWEALSGELLLNLRNRKTPWAVEYPKSLGGTLDIGGPITGTWEELEVRPLCSQIVACAPRESIEDSLEKIKLHHKTKSSIVDVNYDHRNTKIGAVVLHKNEQIVAYNKAALEKQNYNPALTIGTVIAENPVWPMDVLV